MDRLQVVAGKPGTDNGCVYRGHDGSQLIGSTTTGVPGWPEQPREEEDSGDRGLGSGCGDPHNPFRSGAIWAVEGNEIHRDDSCDDRTEAGGVS